MPNQSGRVYGLTLLCPIRMDEKARPSHDLQIREYLATLPTGAGSPFAAAPGTHMARLAVMDDVIYVGMPACEEHLNSKYLVFEVNSDLDLPGYIAGMAASIPETLDAIWSHCTGYPGAGDPEKLIRYMQACQVETTFFFAAVNNKTRDETLRALTTQRAVADLLTTYACNSPSKDAFARFLSALDAAPPPAPGAGVPPRRTP